MTDKFMAALDDCLSAIASGATVEAAAARYPALANELRTMLEAALAAGASGTPLAIPRAVQMTSRAKFLARAAALRSPAPHREFIRRLFAARALATSLAVVLALVIGLYGIVSAATQSLPGDVLYGVKRTVEQVQLSLAPDPQTRAQLEEQFAARRVDEARALTAQKREAPIEFRGWVESIRGEWWTVEGMTVIVTSGTHVNGAPTPGALVEVLGTTKLDGTVHASEVSVVAEGETATPVPARPAASATVAASPTATPTPTEALASPSTTEGAPDASTATSPVPPPGTTPTPTGDAVEVEFVGVVELIVGSVWHIGGQAVTVTASTELRGDPQVGRTVEVKAMRQPNGALVARRIEVKASGTSGPSGPSASNTPQPTHTPGGGGSGPSPSNTPQPTQTPQPSHTPQPAQTSEPTETPHPEEIDFKGTLQSISGNVWAVDGQAVTVTSSTEIKDNPQVGDRVRVKALRQPDGSLIAERIEKR